MDITVNHFLSHSTHSSGVHFSTLNSFPMRRQWSHRRARALVDMSKAKSTYDWRKHPASNSPSLAVASISSSHSACPMSNNLRQTARQDRLDEKMSISVYGCIYTIVEHDVFYFFSPSLCPPVGLQNDNAFRGISNQPISNKRRKTAAAIVRFSLPFSRRLHRHMCWVRQIRTDKQVSSIYAKIDVATSSTIIPFISIRDFARCFLRHAERRKHTDHSRRVCFLE